MDHDKYFDELMQHLSPEDQNRLRNRQGLATADERPRAPFNNFFGDDLLTLLYLSEKPYRSALDAVRENLIVVSSRRPKHKRAIAALLLGRFTRERSGSGNLSVGCSSPLQWFELSRQFNSVEGALEAVQFVLLRDSMRVELDVEHSPLPRLFNSERLEKDEASECISQAAAQALYLGARMLVRHVQRRFSGWTPKMFHAAFVCLTGYLTLIPRSQFGFDVENPVNERRSALAWIKPLWNKLIVAESELHLDPSARKCELVEQQLAVFAYLDSADEQKFDGRRRRKAKSEGKNSDTPVVYREPGADEVVIVKGEIPASTDRAEAEYLKQFDQLREPLAFQRFPSLAELKVLQGTLQAEFPWAEEAIALVMSDLFARKRHGVRRLGMAPVLLVGPPGTGKTRFVQRLSELLGTPNLVINLAGMTDVKVLKGVTRGWASNRPSRMVEFIKQTKVPNPLFILDEIDKAHCGTANGGDPQDALLDLLEPGNARRYQDVYLMAECDLSHCMYVATSNSLEMISEPLLSRLRPVLFPKPGVDHSGVILKGIVRDLEVFWGLPAGALTVSDRQVELLKGLSAREMRRALLELLGSESDAHEYAHH